jgi:hypothetical protein
MVIIFYLLLLACQGLTQYNTSKTIYLLFACLFVFESFKLIYLNICPSPILTEANKKGLYSSNQETCTVPVDIFDDTSSGLQAWLKGLPL